MNDPTLLYVMTAAIIVAAVSIVIQTGLLFGMYRSSKAVREQVNALSAKAGPVLESAQKVLSETQQYVHEFGAKGNEVLDLSRRQLVRIDEVLAEAVTRTRVQMERVELVLDDTMTRFQETTTTLQRLIVTPARQIGGIVAGVSTALNWMLRGSRTTPEQATHDEEMFI